MIITFHTHYLSHHITTKGGKGDNVQEASSVENGYRRQHLPDAHNVEGGKSASERMGKNSAHNVD